MILEAIFSGTKVSFLSIYVLVLESYLSIFITNDIYTGIS